MGTLHYDGRDFDFEDRLLAHLEMVIGQKLRRGESFLMTWVPADRPEAARCAIWIGSGIPIFWEFAAADDHPINRDWIEHLLQSASSTGGLLVTPERLL
ncbi:MAG TPA: hypothetical protein VGC94_01765, partial [Amnibacterium sp.]